MESSVVPSAANTAAPATAGILKKEVRFEEAGKSRKKKKGAAFWLPGTPRTTVLYVQHDTVPTGPPPSEPGSSGLDHSGRRLTLTVEDKYTPSAVPQMLRSFNMGFPQEHTLGKLRPAFTTMRI